MSYNNNSVSSQSRRRRRNWCQDRRRTTSSVTTSTTISVRRTRLPSNRTSPVIGRAREKQTKRPRYHPSIRTPRVPTARCAGRLLKTNSRRSQWTFSRGRSQRRRYCSTFIRLFLKWIIGHGKFKHLNKARSLQRASRTNCVSTMTFRIFMDDWGLKGMTDRPKSCVKLFSLGCYRSVFISTLNYVCSTSTILGTNDLYSADVPLSNKTDKHWMNLINRYCKNSGSCQICLLLFIIRCSKLLKSCRIWWRIVKRSASIVSSILMTAVRS